ncbi:DUF2075 domain-containing protein [Alkalicoccus urumqiensis]|uniref:ATP-binding protein n=1 Tax=Alkalicoccus urumqiensis TaxID=1548213 RepID=A0A2P6MJF5_ALKUR|nr:DUF2075 domain-containing protein [Alkalicoccus urumqiensis]PRO66422.1 ATP-binding protein [Alkalicoccus urumqiensis]
MIVYEASKKEFLQHVDQDVLVMHILERFQERLGRTTGEAEIRSWDHSMLHMYRVLLDEAIPEDAGVAIEYSIPQTSKRVDFLLSGYAEDREQVVVIELKQWSALEKVEGKEAVVRTALGGTLREVTHPSYQAWSYAALIEDFNQHVQEENIHLVPCAYLHNYREQADDPLTDPVYADYTALAPVFGKGDVDKLRRFLKRWIHTGDRGDILYRIEQGRIRPSKSLQDALNSMLRGNEEFVMIDEQKVVFETARELAEKAAATGTKQVMIIEGGPGTGKSVLAVNLLAALTSRELTCQYVTKNAAPRSVYAAKLKGDVKKTRIDNLFKGSGSYTEAGENELDALLVDEAHRLNEKSGMFQHLGENQTKEIIHAAKFSMFFIDEAQRVTLKDKGSTAEIRRFAEAAGAEITSGTLHSQFRCDGSDGYIAWLDDVLGIRETANAHDMGMDYDFRVFSDPHDLLAEIKAKNVRNKARLLAGYCWEWPKKHRTSSEYPDIVLPEHDFAISWNLDNTETWAIDETSVHEAGCIHTSQGLEFDYTGVIIGDDLRMENGRLITDPGKRAKSDQSLRGIKKIQKEDPEQAAALSERIIKNTYRTLMTRGQKGCYVYCTDKPLADYLRSRLEKGQHGALYAAERGEEYR